jgi:hypothetical protein
LAPLAKILGTGRADELKNHGCRQCESSKCTLSADHALPSVLVLY